jgi:hypothetical protein
MPGENLLAEACARLAGLTKLPDSMPEIDVCTSGQWGMAGLGDRRPEGKGVRPK